MKRTPSKWWDARAYRNQFALSQLDLFALSRRYLPAEAPRRTRPPSFRSAAHGGSARSAQSWTPQAKWQPKAQAVAA